MKSLITLGLCCSLFLGIGNACSKGIAKACSKGGSTATVIGAHTANKVKAHNSRKERRNKRHRSEDTSGERQFNGRHVLYGTMVGCKVRIVLNIRYRGDGEYDIQGTYTNLKVNDSMSLSGTGTYSPGAHRSSCDMELYGFAAGDGYGYTFYMSLDSWGGCDGHSIDDFGTRWPISLQETNSGNM